MDIFFCHEKSESDHGLHCEDVVPSAERHDRCSVSPFQWCRYDSRNHPPRSSLRSLRPTDRLEGSLLRAMDGSLGAYYRLRGLSGCNGNDQRQQLQRSNELDPHLWFELSAGANIWSYFGAGEPWRKLRECAVELLSTSWVGSQFL